MQFQRCWISCNCLTNFPISQHLVIRTNLDSNLHTSSPSSTTSQVEVFFLLKKQDLPAPFIITPTNQQFKTPCNWFYVASMGPGFASSIWLAQNGSAPHAVPDIGWGSSTWRRWDYFPNVPNPGRIKTTRSHMLFLRFPTQKECCACCLGGCGFRKK